MDAIDILTDLAGRPLTALATIRERLDPDMLNYHPGGHDNSIAWLLWHSGREIDVQIAALSGGEQVWTRDGYRGLLNLEELGDSVGYGHTPEQARSIVVDDPAPLLEYVEATIDSVLHYLRALTPEDLDDIVDDRWDPPVSRGVRLVSIVDDAVAHLAQVAYIVGMEWPS